MTSVALEKKRGLYVLIQEISDALIPEDARERVSLYQKPDLAVCLEPKLFEVMVARFVAQMNGERLEQSTPYQIAKGQLASQIYDALNPPDTAIDSPRVDQTAREAGIADFERRIETTLSNVLEPKKSFSLSR